MAAYVVCVNEFAALTTVEPILQLVFSHTNKDVGLITVELK